MDSVERARYGARIARLDPVDRLREVDRDALLASSSVEQIAAGEPVYQSADSDQFAHYLLLGAIDILRDKVLIKRLLHTEEAARFPLVDAKGPTQIVRANSACVVLRISRERLDRGLASAISSGAMDGASDDTTHWMNTLLQSGIYARLPPQNIQLLFTRMHTLPMWVGDTVIHQGDVADYYYVVRAGSVAVIRENTDTRSKIQLATLEPGDSFGEEALISGRPRNASIRALSDGILMRLARNDFLVLIYDPLRRGLSFEQAQDDIRRGARWLDIRYQDAFVRGSLPQAVNIPLAVLRIRRRTLPADSNFVVCSDDPELSAIGAFLLIESGLDASYLNSSVLNHFTPAEIRVPPVITVPVESSVAIATTATSIPSPPLTLGASTVSNAPPFEPQADLSATLTGRSLATLIEQLEAERRTIGSADKTPSSPVTPAVDDPLEATHNTLSRLLDKALADEPSTPLAVPTPIKNVQQDVADMARDFQTRLAAYIDYQITAQRSQIETEIAERTTRIKDAAVREVKRNAATLKQRYTVAAAERERTLVDRERQLQTNYERLLALAARINHQKAEINRQRALLEDKLNATHELHRQLADIAKVVSTQMDDLDGIVQSAS